MNDNLIEQEDNLAKKHLLRCDNEDLVLLTIDNVARVEAILQMDAPLLEPGEIGHSESD